MADLLLEPEWQIANTEVDISLEEALLTQRGMLTAGQRERYFDPDVERDCHSPFKLPDMEKAVERLDWAMRWRELIVIFGDYDVDGVTATVLVQEALERMGGRTGYIMPHRQTSGYGLDPTGVEQAAEMGAGVIVTVDNGVTALEGAKRARELDIDLIVTDHHPAGPELPGALALIDPNLPGSGYPFGGISGVGVALKLSQALGAVRNPNGRVEPPEPAELELTALGTIADVSPLVDENRALVKVGLQHLNRTLRPGLRQMVDNTRTGFVDTRSVGFELAHRLNAAGRIEAADIAVRLLQSQQESECRTIIERLEQINLERRRITQDNTALALTMVDRGPDRSVLVVHHPSFHPGVAGLVAGRLSESYHRPSVALTLLNGRLSGSARSPPGFDIGKALDRCDDLLLSHGGHPAAAGLSLEPGNLEPLTRRLHELGLEWQETDDFAPRLDVDSLVEPDELVVGLIDRLEPFAPFGNGNPRPVLGLASAKVDRASTMGQADNHLRLEVVAGRRRLKAVGWNMGSWYRVLRPGQAIGLAFTLRRERWQGREGLQLEIQGLLSSPLR